MLAEDLIDHYAEVKRRLHGDAPRRVKVAAKILPPKPVAPVIIDPRIRRRRITADEIIRRVAKWYGVTPKEIKSERGRKRIIKAKQCAMYWIKRRLGLEYTVVGRIMGGRDHTTIMHGVKAHKATRDKRNHERNQPAR